MVFCDFFFFFFVKARLENLRTNSFKVSIHFYPRYPLKETRVNSVYAAI